MFEVAPSKEIPANLRFVSGAEAQQYLDAQRIDQVTDVLTEANFSPPDIVAKGIRMQLREMIERTSVDPFMESWKRFADRYRRAKYRLYPSPTKAKQREHVHKTLSEHVQKDETTVLLEDGKLAATASIADDGGQMPDGRIIYEIVRVVTLPEFRRKHYGEMIIQEAVRQIQEQHPGNPILVHTRGEAIKKICRKAGWKEGGYKEWLALQPSKDKDKMSASDIERATKGWEKNGWRVFFFDPQESVEK